MYKPPLYLGLIALMSCSVPSEAFSLEDCARLTMAHHAGDVSHVDLGSGQVMWEEFGSFDGGSVNSVVLVDCATGDTLNATIRNTSGFADTPFDNYSGAKQAIDENTDRTAGKTKFAELASHLKGLARNIRIETSGKESCACAALYADLQGGKEPFDLKDLEP